jgi:transposase-like protein
MNRMKQPVVPEIKTRKKFDRAFKQEAVALWLNSGKSAQVIAAELGLRDKQLYLWKQTFAPVAVVKFSVAELEAQNLALRRDNELLRQQRDILKKTLGILSDTSPSAMPGLRP